MSFDVLLQTNASESDYPSIRPTLDLNFSKTKTLDPRITYSRNSIGTYTGIDGYIKTAVANEPRFDYDPTTGRCLGLLVEPSRQNLALWSGDLSQSSWYASTRIANQGVSPDGSSNAWKITYSGYGGLNQNLNITSGVTYTVSVWLKAVPGMIYPTNAVTVGYNVYLGQDFSSIIRTDVWTRCSVTFTSSVTSSSWEFFFGRNGNASGTYSVYAWGPQVEVGDYASSYIPTSGSTVTRQADVVEMTGTNFSSWYNSTKEGTLYFDTIVKPEFQNIPNAMIVALSNAGGDFSNVVGLWGSGGTRYFDTIGNNAGGNGRWAWNSSGYSSYSINPSSRNKYAIGFKVGNSTSNLAINGNLMGSRNTTLTTPLGLFLGGGQTSQTISKVTYYPKRLPDYQLQLLTK